MSDGVTLRPGDPTQVLIHVNGMNPDVDSGTEDIWNGGGLYAFPAAAAATTVLSDNAADAAAGTGARTVRVIGLDANLRWVEQDVTMNGTSTVALATNLYRLIRARVLTAGSNGTNVGKIFVRHGATNLCAMPATPTLGRTHIGIFTVPASDVNGRAFTSCYVLEWGCSIADASANTVARVRLDIRRPGGAWESVGQLAVLSGGAQEQDFKTSLPLAAGTDIRAHCIDVSSANTTVSAHIDVLLLR